MNSRDQRPPAMRMRIFLIAMIASAVTAVGALIVAARRMAANRDAAPEHLAVTVLAPSDDPIAAEAQVFRTRSGVLAIAPTPGPRRSAHPRTLATYRSLRAYPGAPPRIPHGLTPREFQAGGCNTCHERGGFSPRFEAYVPVTPHPEMRPCLQCHVGDAKLMAIPLPNTDPNARCRQCHAPDATRWTDSTLNWKPMAWPRVTRTTRGRDPPPIPHALELRGNCLACHAAPAAVEEIRTAHPERADCRQCHVAENAGADAFVRRAPTGANGRRGGS